MIGIIELTRFHNLRHGNKYLHILRMGQTRIGRKKEDE